jgi:hypothetical protein
MMFRSVKEREEVSRYFGTANVPAALLKRLRAQHRHAAVRALEFTGLTNVPRAVLGNSLVPKAMIQ